MPAQPWHLPLASIALVLGVASFSSGLTSLASTTAVTASVPPPVSSPVEEGVWTTTQESSTSALQVRQMPVVVKQEVVKTPTQVSQLLPDLPTAVNQPVGNVGITAERTYQPDPGSQPFQVTQEDQYLIESASYLKDVVPFDKGSGPGTEDRMQEWLNSDRSITNYNSARAFAVIHLKDYGWGLEEWAALDRLWWNASGWATVRADGNMSLPWGIPQALPATAMSVYGADYLTNPQTQILWGLNYIKQTYGTPGQAWAAWRESAKNGGVGNY